MWMRPVMLARPWCYGYTWCNMYLMLLWYITRNQFLASVLWCNSWGIVLSYESGRIVCPATTSALRRRLCGLDTASHYLPLVLLYGTRSSPVHALVSSAMHLIWGYTHRFDVNAVYQLKPPITAAQSRIMFAFAMLGHAAPCVKTGASSL